LAIEPVVYTTQQGPYGDPLVATHISIKRFLQDRTAWESIEGPLTECELSEVEVGDSGLGEPAACQTGDDQDKAVSKAVPSSHKDRQRRRTSSKRAGKRARCSQGNGPGSGDEGEGQPALKGVTKKRRLEGTRDALKLAFDMGSFIGVTQPGWIGRSSKDLPVGNFTREQLVLGYSMTYFPWDGVCVFILPSIFDFHSGGI
jgi:hypothetical protein